MNSIAVNDYSIFIGTNNSILKFDKNFNFISYFPDSLLEKYSGAFSNIGCYKNKLILSTAMYDSIPKIVIFNDDMSIVNEFDFFKKFAFINNYYNYNGRFVVKIFNRLFYMNNDFSGLTFFFSDTNKIISKSFNIVDDKLYECMDTSNNISMTLGLELRGYDKDSCNSKLIGKRFINKYYINNPSTIGGITTEGYSLSVALFYYNPVTVFEDSIIVMAGKSRSLLVSTDRGNTWELKSYIYGYPKYASGDSVIYFGDGEERTGLYLSTDRGATFSPAQYSDNSFMQLFKNIPYIYFDNSGIGFIVGYSGAKTNNIASSVNFGKSFDYKSNKITQLLPFLYITPEGPVSNIIKTDKYYYLAKNYYSQIYGSYMSYVFQLDSSASLDSVKMMVRDTLNNNYLHLTATDSPSHIYLFCKKLPVFYGEKAGMQVRETQDSGRTWTVINTFETVEGDNKFYEHNRDSVFFTSLADKKVYLYDRKRNVFDTLASFPNRSFTNLQVAFVNNKFHILGDALFLENSDRNDLTQWTPASWDYGTPSFYRAVFLDNVLFAEMKDSIRPRNNYRIEFMKTVGVEEPAAVKSVVNIFPNPSNSFITFESENENARVEIYNIMGIKQMDIPWSKQINISSLAPGVYFIRQGARSLKFVKE